MFCLNLAIRESFSAPHDIGYSIEAVQEANLATRFNPLFWECACLSINAGISAIDTITDLTQEDNDEEDTLPPEEDNIKNNKSITPNYVKISKAITDAQLRGVSIELPDINKAEADFVPDIEKNGILYSLRTVAAVSDILFQTIIEKRPFINFQDFRNKVPTTVSEMVGLIKAGCFDNLVKAPRRSLLLHYLNSIAEEEHPKRDKLTSVQLKKLIADKKCRPKLEIFNKEIRLFNFYQYIKTYQNSPNEKTKFLLNDVDSLRFFKELHIELHLKTGSVTHLKDGLLVNKTAFKKWYDQEIDPFIQFLNSQTGLDFYHNWEVSQELDKLKEKYDFNNSVASWEMEQVSFYHSPHELKNVNKEIYQIRDFNNLPEEPEYEEYEKNGQTIKTTKNVCGIAGTVVGSNNTKNIISLLTPYGVVDVKLYRDLYNKFKAKISVIDVTGKKKTTIDDSWFKRGTKLLVYGFRRENMFVGKQVKINGQNACILLIEEILPSGRLKVRSYRKKAN